MNEDLSLTLIHPLPKTAGSVQNYLLVWEVEVQRGSVTKTLQPRAWIYKLHGSSCVNGVRCNEAPILAVHILFNSMR